MIRKINIVLVMVLLTSIVANAFAPLSVVAVSNDTMFYNEMILTALVDQRPFVIDMLTGDTFGSNPNAEIHGLDGKSFHYKELLDELAENEMLSTVIGLAYFENIVEEVGTQIIAAAATGAQTTIHALLSFYPEMKPEALASVSTTQICNALGVELTSENADKYNRIRDNVRQVGDTIVFLQNKIKLEGSVQKSYGAILNHALTKTYTSSAGNTTAFEETDMGILKTISEYMKLSPQLEIESMNIEEKIDLPDIAKNIKDVGTLINDRIMVEHTNAYTKALFSSTKNAGESQLYTLSQMIKYDKSHASGATNRYTRFSIQSQLALDTLQKDGIYQYLATKQAWRNHILKLSNKETDEIYEKNYKAYYDQYKKNSEKLKKLGDTVSLIEKSLSYGKQTIENIQYFESIYQNYENIHRILSNAINYLETSDVAMTLEDKILHQALQNMLIEINAVDQNGNNILVLSMLDTIVDIIKANDLKIDTETYPLSPDGGIRMVKKEVKDLPAVLYAERKNLDPVATKQAWSSKLKGISNAFLIAKIAGDIVFNFSDYIDKYCELYYLDHVIDIFEMVYLNDYHTYLTNRSTATAEERDRLAEICLNDLEFLKILKCRAETVAFDIEISAFNCVGGKVYEFCCGTPGYVKEEKELEKKEHLDVIIDTMLDPYSGANLSLTSGQRMIVQPLSNGNIGIEIQSPYQEKISETETVTRYQTIAKIGEGQYVLRGSVTANSAEILMRTNVYFGTLTLNNSVLHIVPGYSVDTIGCYGLEMKGSSTILSNGENLLIDTSYTSISGNAEFSGIDLRVSQHLTISTATILGSIRNSGHYTGSGASTLRTLIMSGTETTEYSGGTLTVKNLLIDNSAVRGIALDNIQINVEGILDNPATYVANGQNIAALSTASFSSAYYHSDVTLKDLNLTSDMIFGGTIHTSGAITLGGNNLICGGITQESNTLHINTPNVMVNGSVKNNTSNALSADADTVITVKGDMDLNSGTANLNGTVRLEGDLIANSSNAAFNRLELIGTRSQSITNTATSDYIVKAAEVVIGDRRTGGIRMKNNMTVSGSIHNMGCVIENGERITLGAGGTVISGYYKGNLTLDGASLAQDLLIDGDLVIKNGLTTNVFALTITGDVKHASGTLTVSSGGLLNALGTMSDESTGKICTVAENGKLQIGNMTNLSGYKTVTVDGTAEFGSDLTVSGTVSGLGTIRIGGNLTVTGTLSRPAHVILTSTVGQTVSGGTLNFQNLTVHNTSGYGIRFMKTANVYGAMAINAKKIVNEDYLIQKAG